MSTATNSPEVKQDRKRLITIDSLVATVAGRGAIPSKLKSSKTCFTRSQRRWALRRTARSQNIKERPANALRRYSHVL
jgi:hypothetical protein